ncbi:NAD(P)-binding protein [Shivajiella indica]|uniref:NAD(P)-binding protein n=1 Tax=Shivajiella indica TaxID=872115 RepID=A0ABW5B5W9_9BACT
MESSKKKIIILGGGMASLSAAYELTDYEGWQNHYEITLYQVGWRLGGKTATGRGPCDRIEEHGIHILQGWYDTTFRLLRSVYDERKKEGLAPGSPLQDLFKDGLIANNTTLMTEFIPELGKWCNWPLIFPETTEQPGIGGPLPMWAVIRKGIALTLEMLLGSPYAKNESSLIKWVLDHFFPDYKTGSSSTLETKEGCMPSLFKPLAGLIGSSVKKEFNEIIEELEKDGKADGGNTHKKHSLILRILERYVKHIEKEGLPYKEGETPARHIALGICFAYYNLKGVLKDVYNPETRQFDFDKINNYDYREWLGLQGAPQWLVDSVIVRFFYTGTFANLVNENGGAVAAGTALQFFAKSVGYKGSFVYQMVYGTGEVMVMPMYEVLKHRGVQFKFFHKIQQVHYAEGGSIESISYAEQVQLAVPEYNPVKKIMNDKLSAWPAEPLYEQLNPEDAKKLISGKVNLEDPWADWTDYKQGQLQKGIDFDEVILGIPVGTLKTICSEIIEKDERWKLMAENVKTTPTQSAQLWFLPSLEELGFDRASWGLPPKNGAPNVVVYQNPMYSWLDSSLVLPNENWPAAQKPKFLAYFTGPYLLRKPLPPFTDHGYQSSENERLKTAFEQWLYDNAAWFWPKGATYLYPQGLNFQLLADIENSPDGYTRYSNQFFRANVRPTDHYTLSVPNSAIYRLKADASGFDNMFLCGDWIDFGGNVGYIDGTIQSGQQAAQALRSKMQLGGHKEIWATLHSGTV